MTIRNDASRPEAALGGRRRARSVVARQGQVLLDIDVTSAGDIAADRTEVETLDTLGPVASPLANSGFQIGVGGTISDGRLYVDGLLVENSTPTTLAGQPHPAASLPAGPALVGLKALIRHIDPVEDRRLTDKALGDAATSGRAYVDWQVFALPVAGPPPIPCGVASPDWDKLTAASSGRLTARVDPGAPPANFCTPAAGGGYVKLENLLYRIEVDGGAAVAGYPAVDGPRFGLNGLRLKLSRRNASVMTRIVGYTGRELTVDPPALDIGQWFAAGGAAEIVSLHDDVDPRAAVAANRLFLVATAIDDRVILAGAGVLPLPAANALGDGWYLRLWETFPNFAISAQASGSPNSAEIDCGDGVLVTLHAAQSGATLFRRGDWWSFTARVDGTIDWPQSAPNTPIARVPDGPRIHYARLAVVDGPAAVPVDCRPVFLPLTKQQTLLYHGGDGQEACLADSAAAFVPLREKLRLAVVRGGLPVANVSVRWSTPAGAPASQVNGLATPVITSTDASGLTEVTWALDRAVPDLAHAVIAELVAPPGPRVASIQFGAAFETARRTSYDPGCDLLKNTSTVQEALDVLCQNISKPFDTLRLERITLLATKRELIKEGLILNGLEVLPEDLLEGIEFELDRGDLKMELDPDDPIVDLEIEMPYPITRADEADWNLVDGAFATVRLRLDGELKVGGKTVRFTLTQPARRFLDAADQGQKHRFGMHPRPRYVMRLRLRSQWIWVEGEAGRTYLNAAHLALTGPVTRRELDLREREPRRAADLDMFFYLRPKVGRVRPNIDIKP